MIVYNDSKAQFVSDVVNNEIADKILELTRKYGLCAGQDREYISWQNSMQFMRNIVDSKDIDDDVRIAIEYQIPLTSKRVDFIISGSDADNNNNVVIVELKQWTTAEVVDDEMTYCVRTYVANADRIVSHPSYQAYAYSRFIYNYAQTVSDENIKIVPCAYLHNFAPESKSVLANPIYEQWYKAAPFFIKNEVGKFSDFVKKYVTKKSSKGDLLYLIDNGRIRPTKALQDSLVSMVKGNKEFMLLDEQAVVYDMCVKTMTQCKKDEKKRTIVIQGGPGTGKSVLAINLLMEFINKKWNASYITKNRAPRDVFKELLTKSDAKKKVNIEGLFKSSFGLSAYKSNFFDCLIVDEAHRLIRDQYGKNHVWDCINASLCTIFLLDEDQAITIKDIGSVAEVEKCCRDLRSIFVMRAEAKLVSQFRCNGSDAYIQFIDKLLQRAKETVDVELSDLNYDFQVFDNPNDLRNVLREKNKINNKARMVAGYCYNWNVKNNRDEYDIYLEDGFKAKWNLPGDNIWAINPNSFEEVGCIHTAQGLEFDYVGVFIGRDLTYNPETHKVETHQDMISKDDKSSGIRNRTTSPELAHRLLLNTYKTLLTRGQKGCYVYCEDKNLRDYFKAFLNK